MLYTKYHVNLSSLDTLRFLCVVEKRTFFDIKRHFTNKQTYLFFFGHFYLEIAFFKIISTKLHSVYLITKTSLVLVGRHCVPGKSSQQAILNWTFKNYDNNRQCLEKIFPFGETPILLYPSKTSQTKRIVISLENHNGNYR